MTGLAPAAPAQVGAYRLVRRLGAGGMGVVYLGHDANGGAAAVKLIKPEYAADAEFRARLRREVAAARRVPRSCTAAVLAADLEATTPWVATEYIDGPTLDMALVQQRLTGADLMTFAVGVAVALRAIHQYGVIHRDLKPSNILLSPLGPRVIDFGIARVEGFETALTHAGVVIGTPAYMAPEQVRGEPLTGAVDVFAWAGVVSYAATGRPPFGTGEAAIAAIVRDQPDLGSLPESLRSLVGAAFHKDAASRPSAHDLVDRLSRSDPEITTRVLAAAASSPSEAGTAPPQSVPTQTAPPQAQPTRANPTHAPPTPATPPPAMRPLPAPPAPGRPRRPIRRVLVAASVAVLVGAVTAGVIAAIRLAPDGPGRNFGNAFDDGPRWSLTGHTGTINSVAMAALDGTPVAVSASGDETVRLWDLTTGEQIGEPLTGHNDPVASVAIGALDGTPIAVSGGWDGTARVWDLTTGEQMGEPLTGEDGWVEHVAVDERDGTPIAVGVQGLTIHAWDLAAGERFGRTVNASAESVAVTHRDGAPVVVSANLNDVAHVWDLSSGERVGEPLTGHTDPVASVAIGALDGTPIAVSGSWDGTVRVWDLATGEQMGEPLTGDDGWVEHVATTEVAGVPIAVSVDVNNRVRAWDLTTREQVGEVDEISSGLVINSVAAGELDGTPVAVIGLGQEVQVWPLT